MIRQGLIITLLLATIICSILGLYFYVFNGEFSRESQDWGSFGSYLAGTITIPFSILTLYYIYKTYRSTKDSLEWAIFESHSSQAHAAIKEAALFIEMSLDEKVEIENHICTFREAHNDMDKFKKVASLVKNDNKFKHRYMIAVGKPMLCLYDFLSESQNQLGITPTIKFYKLRYQWILNLHNEYELDVIHASKYGISSEYILEFFYQTEAKT